MKGLPAMAHGLMGFLSRRKEPRRNVLFHPVRYHTNRSHRGDLGGATTCASRHADASYMKAYGIPTKQFADYCKSGTTSL